MNRYVLYNDDAEVARFEVEHSVVRAFMPERPELLPMQIRQASADGFSAWLRERAIDLNSAMHRRVMHELLGSRDKLTLALRTRMFSISDTFTCFPEGEFVPRGKLCQPDEQNEVSRYILVSSDTSLRQLHVATPNASTDGSFTKTWMYENDAWWLYKLQPADATLAEVQISRTLQSCGWDAAQYEYIGDDFTRVKTRNFLNPGEFFEPYDSFRFCFDNPGDADEIIMANIASLGADFARAWRRILLADSLFLNTDRHMRNFGIIRSSRTGEPLRLAPNFDNNQTYKANPGGKYSPALFDDYMATATQEDCENLSTLSAALAGNEYLKEAYDASLPYVKTE